MTPLIQSKTSASVTELKKAPLGTVAAGNGRPIAILNRNEPAFYCVPAKAWEALMDRLEDIELNALADARLNDGQVIIKVSLDEAMSWGSIQMP
jgi:antitoxin StbD